jgi:hypothetical protein
MTAQSFTGTRWENRFRPLLHEHWINPVLYVEFENTSGADKTLTLPTKQARREQLQGCRKGHSQGKTPAR